MSSATDRREIASPHSPAPTTWLLANGDYSVMLTAAGSGCSRWDRLAITRWREDATRDICGSYIYVRDAETGAVWSATYQPMGIEPDASEVQFEDCSARFFRRDGTLTTTLDVFVCPEGDGEVRRLTIANSGPVARHLEITSFAELSLIAQSADVAHPAFAKMFVETEHHAELGALIATRRKRSPSEPDIWVAHVSDANGNFVDNLAFETDRARFLGRGRGVDAPVAMQQPSAQLTGSVGDVLDPVFVLARKVSVGPGVTLSIDFWTIAAKSRASLIEAIKIRRDSGAYDRAASGARAQSEKNTITSDEAWLFQRLAGHVVFVGQDLRVSSGARQGFGPQSRLWPLGVSGDMPIVLVQIARDQDLGLVREILEANDFWRSKHLAVDLVILNEGAPETVKALQAALEREIGSRSASPSPGKVFALRSDQMPSEIKATLSAAARVALHAANGVLSAQLEKLDATSPATPPLPNAPFPAAGPDPAHPHDLEFFNGLGGFGADGRDYVTLLKGGQSTPAPWVNVVANPSFGFQTSAEGAGYTWSTNSREFQLTAWSNDAVTDPPGEVFYIRDCETGEFWSPTAVPIRVPQATYLARHGRGFCQFETGAAGIASELLQFVPLADSIKISRLRLTNTTARPRRLEVTAYVEWVLAASRAASLGFVETELDGPTGAALARNRWHNSFGSRVVFADMAGRQQEMTGDRREFIGRNGSLARPAALAGKTPLSGSVGASLDACAAMRTVVEIAEGGFTDIVFFLGDAESQEDARSLILQYRIADLDAIYADVTAMWEEILGAVQVKTPDRATDIMLNGWLLYECLACRVWARSGFYQASGAYGFRDQLQDGMALTAARPDLTREHLLRAAARQFVEGDVQHWWLPESGRGVRTRISDSRVWLAYCVAQYVRATGDASLLDETTSFLEGPLLAPGEVDNFFLPRVSGKSATVFEHCALALDISLAVGRHGLPLIGGGDWNDGMNRVGEKGEGESVWLGWFLHSTLSAFAPVADARGEPERARKWQDHAEALKAALESDAWDGDWYLRGFFDDGTPFGAAASEECRIDAIAQSWAVLSKAAKPERAERAMAEVSRHLIRKEEGLALLFTPPFDQTTHDPGYIKGYPPGVRENGGQYTHAATWSIIAFAELGDGDKAANLFSMLNPINHARTAADVERYKIEPYVVAADVYSVAPHVGRGGWTWYTGSAGWLQRAGVESILGLKIRGAVFEIDPCIPKDWNGFEIILKKGRSSYKITVENPRGVSRGVEKCDLDGSLIVSRPVAAPWLDDGKSHVITARLG